MNEPNSHWSINQRMMIARMTGVVVTPLCRQVTSELWHHCAALPLPLPLRFFSVSMSCPLLGILRLLLLQETQLYSQLGSSLKYSNKTGKVRVKVHEWKKMLCWSKERKRGKETDGQRREETGRQEDRKRCRERREWRQRERWMRDTEKMMHPGLQFLFTKEVPLGAACLCLNAWLAACKGSYYMCLLSHILLPLVGTADPLCWGRHDVYCHTVLLHHSCIPPCFHPLYIFKSAQTVFRTIDQILAFTNFQPQCEDMLISVQFKAQKCMAYFSDCTPRTEKYVCVVQMQGQSVAICILSAMRGHSASISVHSEMQGQYCTYSFRTGEKHCCIFHSKGMCIDRHDSF